MRNLTISLASAMLLSFAITPAPALAQTAEDVAFAAIRTCSDLSAYASRFPSSRLVSRLPALRVSLGCATPRPRAATQAPSPDWRAELAPADGNSLFTLPSVGLTLASRFPAILPPCAEGITDPEGCLAGLLGVDYGGRRVVLNRSGAGDDGGPSDPIIQASDTGSAVVTLNASAFEAREDWDFMEHPTIFLGAALFLRNGSQVITFAGMEGWAHFWSVPDGAMLRPFNGGSFPEQNRAGSLYVRTMPGTGACIMAVYDSNGTLIDTPDGDESGLCVAEALSVAETGGRYVYSAWNYETGDAIVAIRDSYQRRDLYRETAATGALSWDGRRALVWRDPQNADETGTGRIISLDGGAPITGLRGHPGGVLSADWSPDGTLIATGGDDAVVTVWDSSTGRAFARFGGFPEGVCSVRFTPGGRGLVTRCPSVLRVYDVATGRMLQSFEVGSAGLDEVQVSPDTTAIVTLRHAATAQPEVEVWRITG